MGILEDILARLERIEAAVGTGAQPAQTPAPAPQPAQTPAPTPQPTYNPLDGLAPTPQPSYGPPPTAAPQVAGPTVVPSLQELTERLMDLNQAQGELPCLNLLRMHGGQNAEGSVNLKLVPQAEYAALYAAINQQLGVH